MFFVVSAFQRKANSHSNIFYPTSIIIILFSPGYCVTYAIFLISPLFHRCIEKVKAFLWFRQVGAENNAIAIVIFLHSPQFPYIWHHITSIHILHFPKRFASHESHVIRDEKIHKEKI